MVYLLSECCDKLLPRKCELNGWRYPQRHDNKISRPSSSFMIDRTQVTFKDY